MISMRVPIFIVLVLISIHCIQAADDSKPVTTEGSLSVAPLSHTEYAKSRPDWIDEAPTRDGDVDLLPVVSVPCREEKLCDEALKVAMRAATENFAEILAGDDEIDRWLKLDDQWIADRQDAKKRYHGKVQIGNETFYESATVLRFDDDDREEILKQWEHMQVGQRLVGLGVMGVLVVSGLIGSSALLSLIVRRAELRVTT